MKNPFRQHVFYLALFAAAGGAIPAAAHHRSSGAPIEGIAIPSIGHGEMLIYEKNRTAILDLAARQPATDPTLRRLAGFVSLQHFACFRGVVPGALEDEDSPFNECAHAYLAGTRALLVHMTEMRGDQSAALAIQRRIDEELASDPTSGAICANSLQVFDSAVIAPPEWAKMTAHKPTLLTLAAFALLIGATTGFVFLRASRLKGK